MCHEDFFDLKDLSNQIAIKNIYKDSEDKTVKMTDIKVLMVNKENPKILHYKTSYQQEDFLSISIVNARRQEKDLQSIKLNNAYKQRPGITDAKKKGIISLIEKKIVPRYYFDFYNNL
jgi:hypothetical protein